ncbi:gliding motility-associated C-terminal domain-containing protein [Pedobacter yonginense]|uniref:gliding motility-associated C-terminal domain-containing protein n=1 Tax=Pedobacter yonginense TaxID=651869 RepID=UPI0010578087|nr:gliding motility-associated C-terminal domain-containing protein [Pedobacter yonginense]
MSANVGDRSSPVSSSKRPIVILPLYWIGGSGNWNDGSHWSITSGGSPAWLVPTFLSDVYFDDRSFSSPNQTVNITADANCRSMIWNAGAGLNTPKLAGQSNLNLNIYGSMELAKSMTFGFAGKTRMLGNSFDANAQTIKTNGVSISSSAFQLYNGRFDLFDDMSVYNFEQFSGQFYSNAHNISCSSALVLDARARGDNFNAYFNIEGSTIAVDAYVAAHSSQNYYRTNNSTIIVRNFVISAENDPVFYNDLQLRGDNPLISGYTSANLVTFRNVDVQSSTCLFYLSNMRFNNLNLKASSVNDFKVDGSFTIDGVLTADGEACAPTVLRSLRSTGQYTLTSTQKNFDLKNVILCNTKAGNGSAAENKFSGSDGGNNTNWTYTPLKNQKATITLASGNDNTTISSNTPIQPIVYNVSNSTGVTVQGLPNGLTTLYTNGNLTISGTPTSRGRFNYTVSTTGACASVSLGGTINVTNGFLYWVGGSGNWNDGAHWSYTSGGAGSGLVPTALDDVYFDDRSFSGTNQTVNINADASCRSMIWNAGAGLKTPKLTGQSNLNLNIYGSMELAKDMTYDFLGSTRMVGSSFVANAQTLKTNKVWIPSSNLQLVNGRFDLADDLSSANLIQTSGQFYTNGHNITNFGPNNLVGFTTLNAEIRGDNSKAFFDISSSIISTGRYTAAHNSETNYKTTNSTIKVKDTFAVPGFDVPVAYNDLQITGNTSSIASLPGVKGSLTFRNVDVQSSDFTFNIANVRFNNLNLKASSINKFLAGGLYTIDGVLSANGAACSSTEFRSLTRGSQYTLASTLKNFDLKNVILSDAKAGNGIASENKFSGVDGGNNTNWTNVPVSISLNSASASTTVCYNTDITPIVYTIGGAIGASVTGLPSGLTGVYNAGKFTISGTPTSSGTFGYKVSTTGSCSSASQTGTITVTPNATLTFNSSDGPNAQTVCINNGISMISYSVGDATGASVTGLSSGLTGVYNAGKFTISGTPTSSGTFGYKVSTTGSCSSASQTGTITVTPNASLTLNSSGGTDAQTVCINNGISSISYIVGDATGATVTGLPAGVRGDYTLGKLTISGRPTESGKFTYAVRATGTCSSTSLTGTIDVTPNATITLNGSGGTNAQIVCKNSAIIPILYTIAGATGATVTGLPAGVKGDYTLGNLTISGTPTEGGKFTYMISATGSCLSTSLTGTIDVTPNATLTLNSGVGTIAQAICVNKGISSISYGVSDATGATVTGLPAGVRGDYTLGKLTISGTPTESGKFTYTVKATGSCSSTSLTGTIDVTPNARLTLNSSGGTDAQTVCINNGISSISYIVGDAMGATVTGLPAGVKGVYTSGKLTISGTPTSTGKFTYTVKATGRCLSTSLTGTIDVTPNATLTLNSSGGTNAQTVCIDNGINSISYSVGNATGATVRDLPTGVKGFYAPGNLTISGTPTSSGKFTYTVSTTGNCSSTSLTGTIDVTPNASLALNSAEGTNAQTVCINNGMNSISYSVGDANGATVTGLPAGVKGTYTPGNLTISGTPTEGGKFTYSVSATGNCSSTSLTGTIDVTPNATITLNGSGGTNAQTVCKNSAIIPILYTIAGATGATVTGLPAGVKGDYTLGNLTISGTPTESGKFTYMISTTGSCLSTSLTGTIDVAPNATITLNSGIGTIAQAICVNKGIGSISYSVSDATGATVTGLPAGVKGVYTLGKLTISGTPTESGKFTYTVKATGSCSPTSLTGTIDVTPNARLTLSSSGGTNAQIVCINNGINSISYIVGDATGATVTGLPAGVKGVYTSGKLTISGTPTSTGKFTYTVKATGRCLSTSLTGTINVSPNATLTLNSSGGTDAQTVCINNGIRSISYSVGNATGATVRDLPTGVKGFYAPGKLTISGTPSSSGKFTYTVSATGNCSSTSLTGTIDVAPNATLALNSADGTIAQTVCINNGINSISYSVSDANGATVTGLPTGVAGAYASGNLTISGTPTESGIFDYIVSTTGSCSPVSLAGTITVAPNATLTLSSGEASQTVPINNSITNITYAIGNATSASVSGLPAGVTASNRTGTLVISGAPTSSGTFGYTVTTLDGCSSASLQGTITIIGNTYYWIKGGGDWNDGNHWSLSSGGAASGAIPTAADDVVFDGSSVGPLSNEINIGKAAYCKNITVKDPFNEAIFGNGTLYIAGSSNFTGAQRVLCDLYYSGSAKHTIKSGNACIYDSREITFAGTGSYTLGDDFKSGQTPGYTTTVYHKAGTLNTNGKLVTTSNFQSFPLTADRARELNISNSTIELNGQDWYLDGLNLTAFNTVGSLIRLTAPDARFKTILNNSELNASKIVYNDVTFTAQSGTSSLISNALGTSYHDVSFSSNASIIAETSTVDNPEASKGSNMRLNNLNLKASSVNTFKAGGTFTIDGVLTADGTPCAPTELRSSTDGVQYTLTSILKNFNLKSVYLRDAIAGNGRPSENKFAGANGGNNSNWTYTPTLSLTTGSASTTVTVNTPISRIVYTISSNATGATVTGLPAGVTGVFVGEALTISGTPTSIGRFDYMVSTTGGCSSVSLTGTVSVVMKPAAPIGYQPGQRQSVGMVDATASIGSPVDDTISPAAVVTPNGDGRNDTWIVGNIESHPNNTVNIYNRSGTLVFKMRNYKNTWDGTHNGIPLNEDAYFYVIELDGTKDRIKGTVTVVRDTR